jgi:hypothetical protein
MILGFFCAPASDRCAPGSSPVRPPHRQAIPEAPKTSEEALFRGLEPSLVGRLVEGRGS